MKKLLLVLLTMLSGITFCHSQMASVYMQKLENGYDFGYPRQIIPGAEFGDYAWPVYVDIDLSVNTITNVSFASNVSTITFSSPHGLSVNDGLYLHNVKVPANVSDSSCQVQSVPSSTQITIYLGALSGCSYNQPWLSSGTIPTAGHIWKVQGAGMNSTGTWEVIDHGTTAGKYMLRAGNDRTTSGTSTGSPCTPDLHTSTCYVSHPVLSNAFPGVYVEVDPSIVPTCTMTGSYATANLVLSSTVQFTLKFTTTQTPAQNNSREYYVCKPGAGSAYKALPKISGGYEQMFKNEDEPVYANVFANADQYLIWSLVPDTVGVGDASIETFAPPAGDAFVKNGGKLPQAVFHSGTVSTGYLIKACADADPTSCMTVRRWVSAATPPAGNADKVHVAPCETDPVMAAAGGATYDIDPTGTIPGSYPDTTTLPNFSYPWGSTVIYHNELGTQMVLHNYFEMRKPSNWASYTNDMTVPSLYICGKPNPTTGALPQLSGIGAFTGANCDTFTCPGFMLTISGSAGVGNPNPDVYDGNLHPMHHFGIANLRIQDANETQTYYSPGQTPPSGTQVTWGTAQAIRTFAVANYTIKAIHTVMVNDGVLSDNNANGGWLRSGSENARVFGSHFESYGTPPSYPTEHAIYMQDWGVVVDHNLMDGSRSMGSSQCFSMRSPGALFVGNRCTNIANVGGSAGFGGDTEIQDASSYYNLNSAYGPTDLSHVGSCSNGSYTYPLCNNPSFPGVMFGSMDTYAALTSQYFHSFYMVGNAFQSPNYSAGSGGGCNVSISNNHAVNGLEFQHRMYSSYNTIDCTQPAGNFWFEDFRDTGNNSNTGDSYLPVEWPAAFYSNNVIWWAANNISGFKNFQGRTTGHLMFQTNVVATNQFSPSTTNIPLNYGGNSTLAASGQQGLNAGITFYQYPGMDPVDWKFGSTWTPSNFISSSIKPYDPTTLVPITGAASVSAATPLTYPANLYPPIYNAVNANGVISRRTQLTTAGAYDSGTGPIPPSGLFGNIIISGRIQ
jgi:hypothetical protein